MPATARPFSASQLAQLEPTIHAIIKESLGFSEPTLLRTSINCIAEGGEEKDIIKRLCSVMDHKKASKLATKIWGIVDDFRVTNDMSPSRKRTSNAVGDDDDEPSAKLARTEAKNAAAAAAAKAAVAAASAVVTSGVAMTPDQIRQMMSNTLKEIESRKQQLTTLQKENTAKVFGPQKPDPVADDKAQTIASLQAQIASRLEKAGLPAVVIPDRPTPVILDDRGRTVDASGQEIQLSHHVPTLKANLRAKKRDELKEHMKESSAAHLDASGAAAAVDSRFFDPRVAAKGAVRSRRTAFKFNDPGKFEAEGRRLRMKAQLERLQADISTIARKTGITSATQLAKLVPKDARDRTRGEPDVEWWDAHIMRSEATYDDEPVRLREGAITNLIEHPIQLLPLETNKPAHVPVFLTKKEQKKLRRQNRREAWKDKQDKIRLGLLPPDEPKVKMSNLMRVLGTEAVQDPTKIEAQVREQMAKRLAAHEKANATRKLTPEQRKEKTIKKLKEDTSFGVNVAVYRVKNLSNPSKKFKVETNAKQLFMTGCMVIYEDVNVVVVEGGPKQQKKYKQLMLNRIKWEEEIYKDKDGTECNNNCVLVWEGQAKERSFGEMRFKPCPSESFARDFFKKLGVEHYWDQAYSGAVLEATEDPN